MLDVMQEISLLDSATRSSNLGKALGFWVSSNN